MDDFSLLRSLGIVRPSAPAAIRSFDDAFPDAPPRPGERRRVFDERTTIGLMLGQALDGTTFLAEDTDANMAEWPYASGQRPGCGFPIVGALMSHSLVGGGSEVLVTAPWKAHDFRLYVAAASTFRAE